MLHKVTTSRSQILRDGGGSNHFGEKLHIFVDNKKIKPYQNDDAHVLNKKRRWMKMRQNFYF
jgi:hypothetical protein